MAHERVSSQSQILGETSLNMDTEVLEGQEYDLDLTKFTSRVVETYRSDADHNNYNSEQSVKERYENEEENEQQNSEEQSSTTLIITKSGLDASTVENLL